MICIINNIIIFWAKNRSFYNFFKVFITFKIYLVPMKIKNEAVLGIIFNNGGVFN